MEVRDLAHSSAEDLATVLEGEEGVARTLFGCLGRGTLSPVAVPVAYDARGRPVAALYAAVLSQGCRVERIWGDEVAPLLASVLAWFAGQRVEVRLRGPAAMKQHDAAVRAAGFAPCADEVLYARDLTGYRPPEGPLRYRAHDGLDDTRRALARAVAGSPDAASLPPASELMDDLVEGAAAFAESADTSCWRLAFVDDALAGVALGQRHPWDRTRGSMAYVGVVPELRGRGLGRKLHADALAQLAAAGVSYYEDATGAENAAMQRTFVANGCRPAGAARRYLHAPPPCPARLDGFEALRAHLEAQGLACRTVVPGVWLRVQVRFGRHAAAVSLGWLRDEQLLAAGHDFPFPTADAGKVAALNARLLAPGLILDPFAYRQALPLDDTGATTPHLVRALLARVVRTASAVAAELVPMPIT